jgi:uncharacterized spore protein YtfJ
MATTETTTQDVDTLLSKLAERVGARTTASAVFGSPVEREGITVVPVAVARFGFGGGAGSDPGKGGDGNGSGAGAGAGGAVAAAGYIEIRDGRSRFVPVIHPARMFALTLAAILVGFALVRPASPARRRRALPWR